MNRYIGGQVDICSSAIFSGYKGPSLENGTVILMLYLQGDTFTQPVIFSFLKSFSEMHFLRKFSQKTQHVNYRSIALTTGEWMSGSWNMTNIQS